MAYLVVVFTRAIIIDWCYVLFFRRFVLAVPYLTAFSSPRISRVLVSDSNVVYEVFTSNFNILPIISLVRPLSRVSCMGGKLSPLNVAVGIDGRSTSLAIRGGDRHSEGKRRVFHGEERVALSAPRFLQTATCDPHELCFQVQLFYCCTVPLAVFGLLLIVAGLPAARCHSPYSRSIVLKTSNATVGVHFAFLGLSFL